MKKRKVPSAGCLLACWLLTCVYIFPTSAFASINNHFFIVGSEHYNADGQDETMDVAPFIENGRVYLPVRYLAYALGIEDSGITWDASTQTVTLVSGNTVLVMTVGSTTLTVDGTASTMDVAPRIVNGRVMLPARWVAQAFGAQAVWDPSTQTVAIVYSPPSADESGGTGSTANTQTPATTPTLPPASSPAPKPNTNNTNNMIAPAPTTNYDYYAQQFQGIINQAQQNISNAEQTAQNDAQSIRNQYNSAIQNLEGQEQQALRQTDEEMNARGLYQSGIRDQADQSIRQQYGSEIESLQNEEQQNLTGINQTLQVYVAKEQQIMSEAQQQIQLLNTGHYQSCQS